jgi:hypothetical protein
MAQLKVTQIKSKIGGNSERASSRVTRRVVPTGSAAEMKLARSRSRSIDDASVESP